MQWRDSPDRYGLVTRFLHWLMAALLLWQLTGMALKLLLGRHPLVSIFVQAHQPIGLTLLLLVVLRIIWTLANRSRRPGHSTGIMGTLAGLGQRLLYILLLVVPVLGIIRANTRRGGPPTSTATAEPEPWLAALGNVHGLLAWTLLVLILGHVAMAVLHAVVWRDTATTAMLGRSRG